MKKAFFIFLMFFFSVNAYSADDQSHAETDDKPKTLYISTGFTPPVSDFYELVLAEIDKKIPSIHIQFDVLSAERSIHLVNQGINDAECCRIPAVATPNYKNLIPVTESFYSARFTAFSKNPNLNIKRFEDLKPYSTATVLGWKILVNNLNRVNPKEKQMVATAEQLMKMLKMDRIEVALLGYESGLLAIRNEKIENVHTYLNPPLAEKPLFIMLHKKNKQFVGPISKAILELKQDGTIDRLYQKVFLNNNNARN